MSNRRPCTHPPSILPPSRVQVDPWRLRQESPPSLRPGQDFYSCCTGKKDRGESSKCHMPTPSEPSSIQRPRNAVPMSGDPSAKPNQNYLLQISGTGLQVLDSPEKLTSVEY